MDNQFEKMYKGWPLRILLIKDDDKAENMVIDYVAEQIKPYEGFLQFELFRELEKVLEQKLNIKKDAVALCDDLIQFTNDYKW